MRLSPMMSLALSRAVFKDENAPSVLPTTLVTPFLVSAEKIVDLIERVGHFLWPVSRRPW